MPDMREEGLRAYAFRQADIYDRMKAHFEDLWENVPAHLHRMSEIINDPSVALPGELEGKLAKKPKGPKKIKKAANGSAGQSNT